MLRCTVKFCGGCNPRYDRGKAYDAVRTSLSQAAVFELPRDGVHYDVLLIIRGCTGCEYRYEEIDADRRLLIENAADVPAVIEQIKQIPSDKRGG
ncbi:hypothetical protein NE562_03410 [Butyricicoccus faecihominis]|uniref:hypothetical protein n=1 Tax=Butyricicoccaceae TaxID=3085642 RepID=UPI00247A2C7E|nr:MULTISPECIES: hypothetical protein [Butyricicoccaceae]MCQ5128691.1 hypothetical protein [Butyricicoccus faecihominis]WNX85846.1 hypothetical protein RWV98_06150 [Agathobaculum sp. NTUH-O15-33]